MPKYADVSFNCGIVAGKLTLDNPEAFKKATNAREGRFTLHLESRQLTRSDRAHRYYFFVLGLLATHTGHSVDDLHEYVKQRYNSTLLVFTNPLTGEISEHRIGRTTTDLKVADFYDYVEHVRQWAQDDLGCITPEPDPDYWRKREPIPTDRHHAVLEAARFEKDLP